MVPAHTELTGRLGFTRHCYTSFRVYLAKQTLTNTNITIQFFALTSYPGPYGAHGIAGEDSSCPINCYTGLVSDFSLRGLNI